MSLVKLNILDLSPTQYSAGFKDIEVKTYEYSKLNKKQLNSLKKRKIVPVVLGFKNKHYLIDRHHTCYVLAKLGEDQVYCKIVADISHLPENQFWSVMAQCGWCLLEDDKGKKINYNKIPKNVLELKNNYYRSLVFLLIDHGFLAKDIKVPFYEFYLAKKFKKYINYLNEDNFLESYLKAIKIISEGKIK